MIQHIKSILSTLYIISVVICLYLIFMIFFSVHKEWIEVLAYDLVVQIALLLALRFLDK